MGHRQELFEHRANRNRMEEQRTPQRRPPPLWCTDAPLECTDVVVIFLCPFYLDANPRPSRALSWRGARLLWQVGPYRYFNKTLSSNLLR